MIFNDEEETNASEELISLLYSSWTTKELELLRKAFVEDMKKIGANIIVED